MLECKILKACAAGLCLFAPFGAFAGAVEKFPLSDVRLLEGSDFYNAMQTDTAHILAHDTDRFIAPYLMEAGLPTAAPRYGGWESMGVSGQTGGHYLSALSMLYATTGNREALERANRIVDALEAAQEANGTGFIGSGDRHAGVSGFKEKGLPAHAFVLGQVLGAMVHHAQNRQGSLRRVHLYGQ